MAKIRPVKNSKLPSKISSHRQCRKWLEPFFHESVCAYCWHRYDNTDIDHYVPRSLDKKLALEPYNLVLSCIACNRYYKGDYHPKNLNRKKKVGSFSGCYLFDVRRSDVSHFFKIDTKNNKLVACKGIASNDRWAEWNIAFFRLNSRPKVLEKRRQLMAVIDHVREYRSLRSSLLKKASKKERNFLQKAYLANVAIINKNITFLKLFNIKI